MYLIPFLEATAEYQRLKAFRQGEITMISLEKSMANDMARFFRHQGNILLQYLPEEFDEDDFQRAWDRTQLETYLEFRDLLLKHKRRAAYTCLRALENELSIPLEEAAKPRTIGTKISFDDFDEEAYRHIEQYAGARISQIDDSTKKDIREIIAKGFKGELQPDGTTKYKTHQQIAKEIKDKFKDFGAPVKGPSHIRNRAHLVAVTELREAGETSKQLARDKMEAKGWQMLKRWMNMGDDRVSDGCIENGNAGWIDSREAFPSGHQFPPRFPGCRCGTGSRVGDRKERSGLPDDRWIVTRRGDTVVIKQNPKYAAGYDKSNAPADNSIVTQTGKSIDDLYNKVVEVYNKKRDEYLELKAVINKYEIELKNTQALLDKVDLDLANYKTSQELVDLTVKKVDISEEIEKLSRQIASNKSSLYEIKNCGKAEINEILKTGEKHKLVAHLGEFDSERETYRIREALDYLGDITDKRVVDGVRGANLDIIYYKKQPIGTRASAIPEMKTINVDIYADVSTNVHELGHIYDSDPKIKQFAEAFYKRRTEGEPLVLIYPGHPDPDIAKEVARKDKFINIYTGREYGRGYYEVTSMGLQHLYEMPGEFAIKDPDHFKYIMKVLRYDLT